jgi:hypothetical protein
MLENLVCLQHQIHSLKDNGEMALKPLELSPDKTSLTLEVHWLRHRRVAESPLGNPTTPPPVGLLQVPSLALTSDDVVDGFLFVDVCTSDRIYSGHKVTLTTDNPGERPLPSRELLDMQWVLQRLSAISGAAELQDDWSDDDSSDIAASEIAKQEP